MAKLPMVQKYLKCIKLGPNLVAERQTDRQTNSLTPFMGVCGFFISVKFATFLLALLAGG